MMVKLKLKMNDGTLKEIDYTPTKPKEQGRVVAQYLINNGHRASEAAMQVADMTPQRLRRFYQNLVMLGEVKQ